MADIGKMLFPEGGMVLKPDESGNMVLSQKEAKDTRKDEKLKKIQRENEEVRSILFKAADEDVGKKYYLYVYKLVDLAGNRTLVMTIPLDQLEQVDVEKYVKDRVSGKEGGTTYLCYVKDQAGQFPPNREVKDICMRFIVEEDGELFIKERERKERETYNRNGGDNGGFRMNPIHHQQVSPSEMVDAIKDAVNVGVEASKMKENQDSGMAEIVKSLAKTITEKPLPLPPPPQTNNTVELLTALTPILAPLIAKMVEPKPVDNTNLEVLRAITGSLSDIGKAIADTNLKIAEKEQKALEERYKDKEQLVMMIKDVTSKDKDGSGFMAQAMQMMDMSNKVQNMLIASMSGMFKNAMELQSSFNNNNNKDNEVSGEVPAWKLIMERVLDPSSWKSGIEALNALKNPNQVMPTQSDIVEDENIDSGDEITDDDIEGVENKGESMLSKELVNSIMDDILTQIKTGAKPEAVATIIISKYSNYKEEMKEILDMISNDIGGCMKLLRADLLSKAMMNVKKLQQVMDGLKAKLITTATTTAIPL